jgi:transcriptional regulator with XRE-family HTH domain
VNSAASENPPGRPIPGPMAYDSGPDSARDGTIMDPGERGPFSAELRRMRQDAGESQVALSAETGIPQAVISRLENAERLPTEQQLSSLAAHFGADLEELKRRANSQRMRRQQTAWPWDPAQATAPGGGGAPGRPAPQPEGRWVYAEQSNGKRQERLEELDGLCADAYASIARLVSHASHSADPVVSERASAILAQLRKLAKPRR